MDEIARLFDPRIKKTTIDGIEDAILTKDKNLRIRVWRTQIRWSIR